MRSARACAAIRSAGWSDAHVDRLSRQLRVGGRQAMFAVRLLPLAPFAAVNVVAGAIRFPLRDFLLGTLCAIAPGTLALAVIGDAAADAIRALRLRGARGSDRDRARDDRRDARDPAADPHSRARARERSRDGGGGERAAGRRPSSRPTTSIAASAATGATTPIAWRA